MLLDSQTPFEVLERHFIEAKLLEQTAEVIDVESNKPLVLFPGLLVKLADLTTLDQMLYEVLCLLQYLN